MLPDSIDSSVGDFLTGVSQFGDGGRCISGHHLSPLSAGICFPTVLSVDSLQVFQCTEFVEVAVGVCKRLLFAPLSLVRSYYFLIEMSDSHIFSK